MKKVLFWLTLTAVFLGMIAAGGIYLYSKFQSHQRSGDLDLARKLLDNEKLEEAETLLTALDMKIPSDAMEYSYVMAMKLELAEKKGDEAAAKNAAEAILDPKASPDGNTAARAHIYLGKVALRENKLDTATRHFEQVRELTGDSEYGKDVAEFGVLRAKLDKEGANAEIRESFWALLEKYPNSEVLEEIQAALSEINMNLLLSRELEPGDEIYSIARGDSINSIGKKFKLSEELIMRINGITSPRNLTLGRRLKIPSVDFSMVVNKTDNTLILSNKGKFFKKYKVRTGKVDFLTPVGDFTVTSKVKNPAWKDPRSGKSYPPNDPENELGTRWMAFEGSLGIHGTIKPETIGAYASNGCVGLTMPEVEELFDLVRLGTPVKIIGKINKELKVYD